MKTDDDTSGRARVSIETTASPQQAFAALVESERLARWFGTPTGPVVAGGDTRIAFGDGDFFDLEHIELDPPKWLRYSWRFLGLGARNVITWTISRRPEGGAIVTVTDYDPERTAGGVVEMIEGWTDFTGRLGRYLATGERARYDWRRELDGGVELRGSVGAAVVARLFGSAGLAAWQPWQLAALSPGASLRIDDRQAPAELELTAIDRSKPDEIHLVLSARQWQHPTRCTIAVRERPGGAALTFSHVGWDGIGGSNEEQHRQRERFCGRWIESMKRARALVAQS
jgi:uncharacterized protein YndB with AHSA1/START domain